MYNIVSADLRKLQYYFYLCNKKKLCSPLSWFLKSLAIFLIKLIPLATGICSILC